MGAAAGHAVGGLVGRADADYGYVFVKGKGLSQRHACSFFPAVEMHHRDGRVGPYDFVGLKLCIESHFIRDLGYFRSGLIAGFAS